MAEVRVIELNENVFGRNDLKAEQTRQMLMEKGIFFLNIMSSPGSGKTTALRALLRRLKSEFRIGVMNVDIRTSLDAQRTAEENVRCMQIHNGGLCHIDAEMTAKAIDSFGIDDLDLLILENIGNLVCPAEFDTGAHKNMMLLSVPEGDDKPLKYPLMFTVCDWVLLSKMDTLAYFDFDCNRAEQNIHALNPTAKILPISAKTGDGIEEWANWIRAELQTLRERGTDHV